MIIMMRTASALLPLTSLLVASAAFCAATPSPTAAPTPSTPVSPVETASMSPPAAAPVATVASPAITPGEPGTPTAAPKTAAPETQTAPLATSSHGPPNAPTASSSNARRPAPEAEHDDHNTLFDVSGDHAIGGFGGIGVMYTRFAGSGAAQICGEGGVVIDHALTLGGDLCALARTVNAEQYGPAPHDSNDRLGFAYAGLLVRYHFFARRPINLGVGALIGGGKVGIGTWEEKRENYWSFSPTRGREEVVFVVEPQIGAFANLTRWFRVGVTAGYRIVLGVDTLGLSASDLSAPTLGGTIQGGWF